MIKNSINYILLVTTVIISNTSIADSCNLENSQCQLIARQKQAFEDAGIKPSKIIESPTTQPNTPTKQQKFETKPFEIPQPVNFNEEKPTKKKRPPSFVFTPIDIETKDSGKKSQDPVSQPTNNPSKNIQQTGIVYQ